MHFPHMDLQLTLHHVFKRSSFPHCFACHLDYKSCDILHVGLFLDFLSVQLVSLSMLVLMFPPSITISLL